MVATCLLIVEPAPGVDLEGLEVARECLTEVFKLDSPSADGQRKPDSLIDIFNSLQASDALGIKSDNAHSSSSAQNMDAKFSEASKSMVLAFSVLSFIFFFFLLCAFVALTKIIIIYRSYFLFKSSTMKCSFQVLTAIPCSTWSGWRLDRRTWLYRFVYGVAFFLLYSGKWMI